MVVLWFIFWLTVPIMTLALIFDSMTEWPKIAMDVIKLVCLCGWPWYIPAICNYFHYS